jgi:carboxymethylenebutenolidase
MALDIKSAAEWLRQQKNVDRQHLAVLGPCMGGRTTLVALECYPDLWTCACIWYGGECFKPMAGKLPAPADIDRLKLIQCPIEGFFGGKDTNPPPVEVDRLDELLTSLGRQHVFHRYPDAGHGFLNPWHKNYNKAAAKDSWALAVEFLKRKLVAEPASTK